MILRPSANRETGNYCQYCNSVHLSNLRLFLLSAETVYYYIFHLLKLFGQQCFRSRLANEPEVRLCVGRTYIEPPIRELDPVAVEIHKCSWSFLSREMFLHSLHSSILVLHLEIQFSGIAVFLDFGNLLADTYDLGLHLSHHVEHYYGC